MALQYRLERNPLTTPASYSIRFVPRNVANKEDIAADITLRHPNFSKADIVTILRAEDEAVQARLLNGEQVTKEGSFSWYLSFTGRLESPDEPLPPLDECLQVNVRVSPPFLAAIRQNAQTERLPMEKKLPLISTAKDTLLELKDVFNPTGALQLNGADLCFDRTQDGSECVIEGTQSGKIVQKRFIKIEASEIILMPELPAQAHPWNNEHTISVTTHYTEHGTPHSGTYRRRLRTPLTLTNFGHPNPPEVGILTGNADAAYVTVTGGAASADAMLRIQAVLELPEGHLLFNLIDMTENGKAGPVVTVTANGSFTLSGFAGSAVTSLNITVNNYAGLVQMIRNAYSGRLADVLKVEE